MFAILDNNHDIARAFASSLEREGVVSITLQPDQAGDWLESLGADDLDAIEGLVLGGGAHEVETLRSLRRRRRLPAIAICDRRALEETMRLFALGIDDVVAKPVHARELLARFRAIAARGSPRSAIAASSDIEVFGDGRDPIVAGEALALPRRERRILECLFFRRGAWIGKSAIFNQVYGILNECVDENVIESHICRLRKRLRQRLNREVIETQRFLGYRLLLDTQVALAGDVRVASYGQAAHALSVVS